MARRMGPCFRRDDIRGLRGSPAARPLHASSIRVNSPATAHQAQPTKREDFMHWHNKLTVASLAAIAAAAASTSAWSQVPHVIAPADQVIAVKAGRLFDAKLGDMLSNQVVLIKGDRITDVGANLPIPAGAKVVDLSAATVLPGMIDTHVHVNT